MAIQDVVTLIEGTPQLRVPGAADAYGLPRDTNITGNLAVTGTVDGIDIAVDVAANTLKVTNVPTALSIGTLAPTTLGITSDSGADDVVLPAADTTNAGLLSAAKWDEIVANTAKSTNVPTSLSTGTVGPTTYAITSDGAVDDVVLVEADTTNAGLLGSDKWDEIVANTLKISYTDAAAVSANTAKVSADEAGVTAALPVVDETVLVYKTGDATAGVVIDCTAITTATTRTITMPDANVDLSAIPTGFVFTHEADSPGTNDCYFIGTGAGAAWTAGGRDNISFGVNALAALTTGDSNICIGTDCGKLISTASFNVAIGHDALDAASTGVSQCVAIGHNALSATTGGNNNVAVGYLAGSVQVSGDDNVYIGRTAGNEHVGDDCVLIGLSVNTGTDSDDSAVIIGHTAGGGNQSVAIGFKSQGSATGDFNTTLGYQSGNNITTGTHNIIIGHDVDPASATAVHQLSLGTALVGYMSALTDVDYSSSPLELQGPSALAGAAVNLDGGDLLLTGGDAATTGIGVGGQLKFEGGAKGSTGTIGGIEIGLAATSLVGLFGATPVVQQAGTGETTGFVAGSGTSANDDSTFTGNVGSTAYRINDIVKALKNLGVLTA